MKFRCPLIQEVFSDTQSSLIGSFLFLSIHFFHLLCCTTCPCMSEKAMAPHSSTLAWKTPWTEEPGRLQSMGSLRVGHDWATSLSLFTFVHWRRNWHPTPVFLPGESQGQGSLVGYRLWGCTVGQDWSYLAAAAPMYVSFLEYCEVLSVWDYIQ